MRVLKLLGITLALTMVCGTLVGQIRIKDITRLKGERDHKIVGLGLVVGLPGTGDSASFTPSIDSLRSILSKYMGLYSDPMSVPAIKKTGSVALVQITATLPPWHRIGNKVEVTVSCIGDAKSLDGGKLLPTPLQSSRLLDDSVYAVAEGSVFLKGTVTTSGAISGGGTIEKELATEVIEEGKFVLVIRQGMADFHNASMIASRINSVYATERAVMTSAGVGGALALEIARIISADSVEVSIPSFHKGHPYDFVASIERLDVGMPDGDARVIIDTQAKTIVADLGVCISPVVHSHGNFILVIEESKDGSPKTLRDMMEQLSVMVKSTAGEFTSDDLIKIVKGLDDKGALHGKLEYK